MASTKETLQSQDPLTMALAIIGNTLGGASQGFYEDPNTGARNFSILRGAGGAAAGGAEALMSSKKLKMEEDQLKWERDQMERQLKMREETFQEQKRQIDEARAKQFAQEQEQLTGKPVYKPVTRPPDSMMYTDASKTQLTEVGKQWQKRAALVGQQIPQKEFEGKAEIVAKPAGKDKKEGMKAAGPIGAVAGAVNQFFKPGMETGNFEKVGIFVDETTGRPVWDSTYDLDSLYKQMDAVQKSLADNDGNFSRSDMLSLKNQITKVVQQSHETSMSLRQNLSALVDQGMLDPSVASKMSATYGDKLGRKNPQMLSAFNDYLAAVATGNDQGKLMAWTNLMDSAMEWTGGPALRYRGMAMGGQPGTYQQNAATLVQLGRPTYKAGKATKRTK